ncbi:FAD-binding oxidoreductase [Amycolatopsis regifaucium]|uniref:FAD-binding dehydrogenase n=1 Tax=Amycolatopsis regifaucium TaxID=546365 RepID=A0A154MC42_9PSEU|nr:FAD-binding oxidoreductase [Amycolatopsis regifaucium]KZB82132.1 FAD-binding dehydrogenase [Amycolatopsis regifaucium]OKA05798.1 FAD-binding dehydrogenase [Amycolatopsis regifaucium]SFG83581.1 Tat (twin-arginine translocation) pathway signal sequence [Amycolatopsis regifaucium]
MKLERRAFLKFAGATVAGAAASACSAAPPAPAPTSAPGTSLPPSTSVTPPAGPPDWAALRKQVSLLLPGDSGYDSAKRVFNPAFDGLKPAAIAKCAKPEDVQAAVSAAARRVPIAARSGGHSYAGYSVPDGGLMLDLGGMSSVDVQGEQVVIGAGAKLKDVYATLGGAGRCLPAGTCPSVGIAGLTLGGGIGVLARKYGLTCDHLVSARVVTADGKLRTASADSEPELFWALRGGGGGNFGVVTSFTFRTDPAPSAVTVFSLKFPAGSANDVLAAWQQWLPEAPPELWANVVLSGGSPVGARVSGCHVGDAASLNKILSGFAGATRTVKQLDYLGAMKYFSGSDSRQSFVASSRILSEPADPAKLTSALKGRRGMDLLVDGLGGAVAAVAPEATAFWHRKAIGSVQIYSQADPRNRSVATDSVAEVVNGIGLGGGYVNYIDPALPDWLTAYYGDNATRLKQVAKTYDPDKVFRFAQAVTPD